MGSNSTWTPKQNKLFENAVATYYEDTQNFWQKVAKAVGTKTEEEVKRHYEILVEDIERIESDKVPLPDYERIEGINKGCKVMDDQEQRVKYIKLQ